ncbi:MAG: RsmE family RNA methyltransferase [Flavisolibacter sp.]
MNLPLFYCPDLSSKNLSLDEETSKHISVLRLQPGAHIALTDGKGHLAHAVITDNNRKKVQAEVEQLNFREKKKATVAIAISLVKNKARFEWFLEKATEIGVDEIYPLICKRTEKEKFRSDRLQHILISAMLQSQQVWMPRLAEPIAFEKMTKMEASQKFIAHCLPAQKHSLNEQTLSEGRRLLLIGPEGDFTPEEIELALRENFLPVTLGENRLRTETAGVVGAVLLISQR